jgi:hypothetical protein
LWGSAAEGDAVMANATIISRGGAGSMTVRRAKLWYLRLA